MYLFWRLLSVGIHYFSKAACERTKETKSQGARFLESNMVYISFLYIIFIASLKEEEMEY